MMHRGRTRLMLALVASVGVAALLVWAFVQNRKEPAKEGEEERPKGPSRVSTREGEKLIAIGRATQIKSGIAVAGVQAISHREEIRAYGSVLPVQELVDLYNNHVNAEAQAEKARASLEASQKEYERLKALRDNQNISDKAFQAAEATWSGDKASARAAEDSLVILEGNLRQRWGAVLAKWLADQSPALARLIRQQDVLVQVTLPPGSHVASAPPRISLQTPAGVLQSARLISPSPRTDPRIQGISYFYLADVREAGLVPGMNLVALVPAGPEAKGVIVPAAAVVWWQGKSWVYAQRDPDHFIRKEISTDAPVKEGWFISKNLSADDRIAVSGAQLLLSEELRAEIPGEE